MAPLSLPVLPLLVLAAPLLLLDFCEVPRMLGGQTIPNLLPVGVAELPLLRPVYSPGGGRCMLSAHSCTYRAHRQLGFWRNTVSISKI